MRIDRRLGRLCKPLARSHFTFPKSNLRVYALGQCWLGNAGFPEETVLSAPTPVPLFEQHNGLSLDVGWGHAGVVTTDGPAVLIGRPHDFRNTLRHINTRGQVQALQALMAWVGKKMWRKDNAPEGLPPPPAGEGQWAAISCSTAAATALLTSTGSLYTVGHNFYGQCGAGQGYAVSELPIAYSPVKVIGFEPGERVVQVSVGFEHMLAVTSSGGLYSWGRGDRGQLGHGDKESYKSAVRVLGPAEAFLGVDPSSIASSSDGTPSAVETLNDLASASADNSTISAAPDEAALPSIESLPIPPPHARVVACESGVSQSACLTADGRLWVWGKMQGLKVKEREDRAAAAAIIGGNAAVASDATDAEVASVSGSAEQEFPDNDSLSAAFAPGPPVAVGVMDDQSLPRPIYFADEIPGEADLMEPLPVSEYDTENNVEPIGTDTLFNRGVIMGQGLGPTAPRDSSSKDNCDSVSSSPSSGAVPSPHYPSKRRVVALTSGHAHTSFVTDDGRLWLIGMRGRGRLFDDSASVASVSAFAASDVSSADVRSTVESSSATRDDNSRSSSDDSSSGSSSSGSARQPSAPLLSPLSPSHGDFLVSSSSSTDSGSGDGTLPLAVDVPVPELTVQLRPWEVPLGPLRGVRILRLRSSMHHSYAISDDGRVFRWGWKGIVLPVGETQAAGLRVADVQFGYAHAMLLAADSPRPGSRAPG